MKHFYTHLIEIESLIVELDNMELSKAEKQNLANLIDANIHNSILDTVLAELDEPDKKIFLLHCHDGDHEKIWKHLNEKITGIEKKIKKIADDLKKEMHKDIKISQKLKVKS